MDYHSKIGVLDRQKAIFIGKYVASMGDMQHMARNVMKVRPWHLTPTLSNGSV
jgi:hypothetical protein